MGIFDFIKLKAKNVDDSPTKIAGDVVERTETQEGIHKAYIPNFLYKPPYGYPRAENIPLLKHFANYPYTFSVVDRIAEEVANTKWEIKIGNPNVEMSPQKEKTIERITEFLRNPNGNKESFRDIVKPVIRDMAISDSGVWVKVFNRRKELVEIYARDGGSFLKNPDIYGYMGGRDEIILPTGKDFEMQNLGWQDSTAINHYDLLDLRAAYYQYGWTVASMPVPYGKNEVVYFMKSPRTDSVYGVSPISVLADIVLTLVYGSQYNLDFYMNSNMPEGIISLVDAEQEEMMAFKERLSDTIKTKDPITGFDRKIGFKLPITNTKADFIPFQMPSKDLQIIEQQEWFTKIVWMCFGVTADDMGFTDSSNKAVSESMERRFAKRAARPWLNVIKDRINMEIIPEFGDMDIEFDWDDYDLDEDIKRHTLYETQIRMGIKTAEMVAEEEGINVEELVSQKEEARQQEMEMNGMYEDDEEDDDSGSDSEMKHKYISRKKVNGKWVYKYRDTQQRTSKVISKEDYKSKVEKWRNQIKPADLKTIEASNKAWKSKNDTHKKYMKNGRPVKERTKYHKRVIQDYARNSKLAKPIGDKPKVVFMAGIPGSGKTYATKEFYEKVPVESGPDVLRDKKTGESFIVLNADDIKTYFPEYQGGLGAGMVHRESSILNAALIKKFQDKKVNIIVDGTLANTEKAQSQIKDFKDLGYESELIHVSVKPELAMKRAHERYKTEGRYVDYGLIASFDSDVKNSVKRLNSNFDTFKVVSNDNKPKLVKEVVNK